MQTCSCFFALQCFMLCVSQSLVNKLKGCSSNWDCSNTSVNADKENWGNGRWIYGNAPVMVKGWPQNWKTWNTQEFLWRWKTPGILREFCATSEKNCNEQSIFSSLFKYLCKVQWWPVILLELMWNDPWWRSLLHLLFVVITYGKVRLWLWKSLENSEFFSPTLWPPCVNLIRKIMT